MWLSFMPSHDSALFNSFGITLVSNSLIGPIAVGNPISLGSSHTSKISLVYSSADDNLFWMVSVILAAIPF